MTSHGSTQLWFPVADLKPLVDHCLTSPGHASDPQHGAVPLLHLASQGDTLFYLTSNAAPPLLVDAFDPTSAQRVYAIGHAYTIAGDTHPAPADRYGPPTRLASIPLIGQSGPFGHLADKLHRATAIGCDWLVLTLDHDGHLDVSVRPTAHPAPAAQWRDVRLELFGLPGVWPGQIVTNDTHFGWLRPRFTRPVAQQLAATIAAATWLPPLVTPIQLDPAASAAFTSAPGDAGHTGPVEVVGPDPDGFYRVGDGWHWASLDLLPDGILAPYTTAHQPGIDPAELPTTGQDTFTGLGALMWLYEYHDLVLREIHDGGFDPFDPPRPPEYGGLDPDAEWTFRAIEHALRKTAASRVVITGPAAAFTADEIEALILTAADAVGTGLDSLSRRQRELAHRAHALLHADGDESGDHAHESADDADGEEGSRS